MSEATLRRHVESTQTLGVLAVDVHAAARRGRELKREKEKNIEVEIKREHFIYIEGLLWYYGFCFILACY